MNNTFTITLEDVYGKGFTYYTPPAGYTAEFKLPQPGDIYISKSGRLTTHSGSYGDFASPRIILTPIKRKVITFTETGEVRVPQEGEWATTIDGRLFQASSFITGKYMIVTRTESTI